ncbi:MAG TPA: hemerythrin domain-containing protein [Burkholderiaceae bacterium]|nr:hemerythrin domain-containing protein [Burkholderiaceae bacterium]
MDEPVQSVPLSLVRAPAAGFEEPFEMLAACHERVARMLGLLERIQAHVAVHGADTDARQAARDVMRYFDQAAPHHHEDEERHVLPRLRAHGQAALAERLHADHEAMAAAWQRLREDLVALAERGEAAAVPAPDASGGWSAFTSLYRAHVALEDTQAFPGAAAHADAAAREAMGREMAARRGI